MKSIIVAVGLAVVSPLHSSEHAWAVRQTAADIQEMAGKPVAESDLSGADALDRQRKDGGLCRDATRQRSGPG